MEHSLYSYVDTIVGAVGDIPLGAAVEAGGGKTYPGASAPFGMVQLSPDTVTGGDNGPGYSYHHTTIEGFSINHMSGIGWYGDLGNFQVMPVVGETPFHSGTNAHSRYQPGTPGRESEFSHDSEVTKAGYYRVELARYRIGVEATVTMRTGILRMTFPEAERARVLIDLSRRIGGYSESQQVRVADGQTIEGSIYCPYTAGGWGHGDGHVTYTLYFHARFSRPFDSWGVWENGEDLGQKAEYRGENSGFYGEFRTEEGEQLLLKVGISYESLANARENLRREAPHWEFDQYVRGVQELWEEQLSTIEVEGSEADKKKFYTCLYHALLDPRIHEDGAVAAPIGQQEGAPVSQQEEAPASLSHKSYTRRTMFSGWDVYRSEMPLLTLLKPEVVNDMVATLVEDAKKAGEPLARWEFFGTETGCMVGDPGMIVAADAYVKGIRNYDTQAAYEICRDTAFGKYPDRSSRGEMLKYGYIPGDISTTLENAFADWCVGRMAKAMG